MHAFELEILIKKIVLVLVVFVVVLFISFAYRYLRLFGRRFFCYSFAYFRRAYIMEKETVN